ncbi:hypothetical protein N7519_007986 [Penicillium mononematosum]|uniref:uncharacterized protein n=1 Tax=Penicillium mononematosum TaxID=268346 RepID=UPI00254885AA|nr:uncharacterized protein N7519_007986 [Penicillium mononematosum]KAJ6186685.1 hypothetical protein N7519_007986 [Penicillium mononematosum]
MANSPEVLFINLMAGSDFSEFVIFARVHHLVYQLPVSGIAEQGSRFKKDHREVYFANMYMYIGPEFRPDKQEGFRVGNPSYWARLSLRVEARIVPLEVGLDATRPVAALEDSTSWTTILTV